MPKRPPTRRYGDRLMLPEGEHQPRRPGPLEPGETPPSVIPPRPRPAKSSFRDRERKLGIFRQQFYA